MTFLSAIKNTPPFSSLYGTALYESYRHFAVNTTIAHFLPLVNKKIEVLESCISHYSQTSTIRPNGRILLIFTILSEGSGLCPNNPQAQARLTALHPPPSGSKERVNPSPADQRATSLSVKGCNDVPSRTYRPPLTAFRCIATRFRVVQGQA